MTSSVVNSRRRVRQPLSGDLQTQRTWFCYQTNLQSIQQARVQPRETFVATPQSLALRLSEERRSQCELKLKGASANRLDLLEPYPKRL